MLTCDSAHALCFLLLLICVVIIQTTLYVTTNFYAASSFLPKVNYIFLRVLSQNDHPIHTKHIVQHRNITIQGTNTT
jgi:hypothetical protein